MILYSWILENKELVKILYALAIVFICSVIVAKSDRLFRLSMHKGIRYFRNAFLFYGIGFAIRYFFGSSLLYKNMFPGYASLVNFIFEFFMIMAGFFLLYSLLWRKIESSKEKYASSLLNKKITIFYIMALVLAILDYSWNTHEFLFFSQIVLFAIISFVSYRNYSRKGKDRRFLKFYFIAMVSGLIAWSLNALASLYLNWDKNVLILIYFLNIIIFFLFLYGIVNIIKSKK